MPRQLLRRPSALLLPLLLTASLALTGCGGDEGSTGALNGTVLDPPFTVAAQPLSDTEGEPFSLTRDTDKRLTLVFFGYSNCPDICQTVMSSLASAMTRLDEKDREQVDVVFVTTDPARDTESALRRYLDRFDPSFIGLTGDLDTIVALGKPLGVGITAGEKLPSGGYDVTHGTTITGIDSDDVAPVYWSESTSSAQFASDIHTLLRG